MNQKYKLDSKDPVLKELEDKADEELNDIFAKEVLGYEDYQYCKGDFLKEGVAGYRTKSDAGNDIFIIKSQIKPTTDRNQLQHGVNECPGKLYFETVIAQVALRYSAVTRQPEEARGQDYIQATCKEMVIACILSKRWQ